MVQIDGKCTFPEVIIFDVWHELKNCWFFEFVIILGCTQNVFFGMECSKTKPSRQNTSQMFNSEDVVETIGFKILSIVFHLADLQFGIHVLTSRLSDIRSW